MQYINIHTHNHIRNQEILEIQSLYHTQANSITKYPGCLFSIGIHPWHTKDINLGKEIDRIKKNANSKNVVAIGECGLDKLKGADIEVQIEIFKSHALIAEEQNKPLIIHCVHAYQEIISMHQQIGPAAPWIIHDFNKNETLANQLIKNGFILSFGKSLIDKKPSIFKIFAEIKESDFFLETDEKIGINLKQIYEQAANIMNLPLDRLSEIIKFNFEKCFKIKTDDWL